MFNFHSKVETWFSDSLAIVVLCVVFCSFSNFVAGTVLFVFYFLPNCFLADSIAPPSFSQLFPLCGFLPWLCLCTKLFLCWIISAFCFISRILGPFDPSLLCLVKLDLVTLILGPALMTGKPGWIRLAPIFLFPFPLLEIPPNWICCPLWLSLLFCLTP